MGIAADEALYENSVRSLFPQGEYWDGQFADPQSDASLFVKAKAAELTKYRRRMSDLFVESGCQTAVETIGDWERVLLGHTNNQLPLDERREILAKKETPVINRILISKIAQKYGLTLVDIVFPFKASFFGFSEFGRSIFSRPAFYSVFYIVTAFAEEDIRAEAETRITSLLSRSSFGRACFGTGHFFGRSYFDKDYAGRVFSGMRALDDFESEINSKLIASNIAYFLYKL